MASSSLYLFPQEGLNYLLNIAPRGTQSLPNPLYVGLFTNAWVGGVENFAPNTNVTLNTGTYQVTEVSGAGGGGYGRISVSGAGWGATTLGTTVIGSNTINVQQSTYGAPLTFTCNSGTWSPVYGMFVATWGTNQGPSVSGTNVVLWYAPFSDTNSVTLASGDSLAITPTWQSAPYPA